MYGKLVCCFPFGVHPKVFDAYTHEEIDYDLKRPDTDTINTTTLAMNGEVLVVVTNWAIYFARKGYETLSVSTARFCVAYDCYAVLTADSLSAPVCVLDLDRALQKADLFLLPQYDVGGPLSKMVIWQRNEQTILTGVRRKICGLGTMLDSWLHHFDLFTGESLGITWVGLCMSVEPSCFLDCLMVEYAKGEWTVMTIVGAALEQVQHITPQNNSHFSALSSDGSLAFFTSSVYYYSSDDYSLLYIYSTRSGLQLRTIQIPPDVTNNLCVGVHHFAFIDPKRHRVTTKRLFSADAIVPVAVAFFDVFPPYLILLLVDTLQSLEERITLEGAEEWQHGLKVKIIHRVVEVLQTKKERQKVVNE